MFNKKIYTNPYILFIIFALTGFMTSLKYAGELFNIPAYFGPFASALFIPSISAIFFLIACALKPEPIKGLIILLTLSVFIISSLPLLSILNNSITYAEIDDGYRYSSSAHYMVKHETLWGADGIILKNPGIFHYVFNPGYRYFIALELLLFGDETRGLQLFNLFLWTVTICFFVQQITLLFRPGIEKYCLLIFIAGTAIYAPKNILMNLSEWMAVIWLLLFFICFINNRIIPAIIFLGLLVFTRQNLLFASLLLLFFSLKGKNSQQKAAPLIIFLLFISLPLIHNIYYAGKWQWLPGYSGFVKNIIIPDSRGNMLMDILISFYRTLLRYVLGVDAIFHSARQNFFGIVFIPAGVASIILLFWKMKRAEKRFFLLQVILVIAPSLILNWAYFPRFEFLNMYCLLISSFIILKYGDGLRPGDDIYLPKLQ